MHTKKILVTGGCGYIGGHTIVDLLEHGFDVVSVDNLSRGSVRMLEGIEKITGTKVSNYAVDLCDLSATRQIFIEHPDISGIIHFAAYKSVRESVFEPLNYFRNNVGSLLNVLECAKEFGVKHFIFSSSCVVYGDTATLPITEAAPAGAASSPYASTKQIGEAICRDVTKSIPGMRTTILRYFNPVGAHPSALIGEIQKEPENLVPVITQTAAGKRGQMLVFGTDYPTRDGTCVRDYVHVMDIARAHTQALMRSMELRNVKDEKTTDTKIADAGRYEVFNLGSGTGVTVLELIAAFEKVSGKKLDYAIAPRRPGDVVAVYADASNARAVFGWNPTHTLEDMMRSAWQWETRSGI